MLRNLGGINCSSHFQEHYYGLAHLAAHLAAHFGGGRPYKLFTGHLQSPGSHYQSPVLQDPSYVTWISHESHMHLICISHASHMNLTWDPRAPPRIILFTTLYAKIPQDKSWYSFFTPYFLRCIANITTSTPYSLAYPLRTLSDTALAIYTLQETYFLPSTTSYI